MCVISLAATPVAAGELAAIRLDQVARINNAIFAATAPGDTEHLYVATRPGTVRVVQGRELLPGRLLDLRGHASQQGERGLLSIAFDPEYAQNGYLYAAYTDLSGSLVVSRFHVVNGAAALSTEQRLLRVARPSNHYFHYGGQLAFGPDRALYVSTGDGGYGGPGSTRVCAPPSQGRPRTVNCRQMGIDVGHAQDLTTLFGKILRLKPEGQSKPTPVAYGLRNPWRFSFDRATGALYIGDVGFDTYEEVDYAAAVSPRPLNFGWSYYEGKSRENEGANRLNSAGKLVMPAYVYDHSNRNCSIVGGYVYRGSTVPALRGRYVFGDWCTGRIWSLRISGGRAVDVRQEPIVAKQIVSFGEGPGGELYTVSLDGSVSRITSQ